jgi:YHS domain-containing protein
MTMRSALFFALMLIGPWTVAAGAQVPADPQAPAAAVVLPCVQAQAVASQTVDAATARLDAARQTNSGPAMRAAIDDIDRLLRDLGAQLAPCSAAMQAQAPASHAGHAMPAPAPAAAAPVPQSAAGAHAGHDSAPTAPAVAPRKLAAPTPAARAPGRPARVDAPKADAHAGHAAESPAAAAPAAAIPKAATVLGDLKCRNTVDPKTAPRMLHQGQMYYFCNEDERAAFAKEAAKAAPAPTKSAPAHAH